MKRLLPILTMAILMSACVKPNDPNNPSDPDGIHFSVLGDSYSAFEGFVDPENNDVWVYNQIGVTSVEQMWWHQVAVGMGWVMDKNNSFSGSLVSNYSDFDSGGYYAQHSFLRRMDNLFDSDVIFILGGANDVYREAPFGDYVYADWTDEQLCKFRPALAYMLDYLKRRYPNSKLYFLLETSPFPALIPEETRLDFIESTHRITNHYGVDCIDLTIHKDWEHPDVQGQQDIARQVLEVLGVDFNV